MKTRSISTAAALALAAMSSAPAQAVIAVKVNITSGFNGGDNYLQVSEVQAFNAANVNVALATNGGVASASTDVPGGAGNWPGSSPAFANDGIINTIYPAMYHPNLNLQAGAVLSIAFSSAFDIRNLTIFGRSDCCTYRDVFNYSLLDANNNVVASGVLNAVNANNSASAVLPAVPEPATWALMMVGFGALGFGLRRRNATDSRVSFKFA